MCDNMSYFYVKDVSMLRTLMCLENASTLDRVIVVKERYCNGQGKSPSVRSRRTRVQRVECFVQSDR